MEDESRRTIAKLVRDNIPDEIQSEGRDCEIRELSDEEYREHLRIKLTEEVTEFLQDGNVEELVDIMEVVYALGIQSGVSPEQLEQLRNDKLIQKGGFSGKKYMAWTE